MNLRYLYTSFDGRISRKRFWVASLIMLAAAMLVSMVVFTPIAVTNPGRSELAALLLSLALLYPALALGVKRLHDRGRPAQLMAVFLAPGALLQIGEFFGLTGGLQVVAGETVYALNMLGWLLNVAVPVAGIWALVELGLLKGVAGANSHGPDPIAGATGVVAAE